MLWSYFVSNCFLIIPFHRCLFIVDAEITVGAKPSSSAVSNQSANSKPGTVPLVSATSRIIHPEEDTSLVSTWPSLCPVFILLSFNVPVSGGCKMFVHPASKAHGHLVIKT